MLTGPEELGLDTWRPFCHFLAGHNQSGPLRPGQNFGQVALGTDVDRSSALYRSLLDLVPELATHVLIIAHFVIMLNHMRTCYIQAIEKSNAEGEE